MITVTIHKLEIPKTPKATRLADQTIEEACATSDRWYTERKRRALNECNDWTLLPDGTLIHRFEDKQYTCADVEWSVGATSRPMLYIGCDCPDEETHLSDLREKLGPEWGKHPCFCKHHIIRQLLRGDSINVPGIGIVSVARKAQPEAE